MRDGDASRTMDLALVERDDEALVVCRGELDEAAGLALITIVGELWIRHRQVVVDLARTDITDPTATAALEGLRERGRRGGRRLYVLGRDVVA
jgi:anti-anti-sigma regulatory factor